MATFHEVKMLSGKIGYTVSYFVTVAGRKTFWHYTVLSEAEARDDVELLNTLDEYEITDPENLSCEYPVTVI